MRLCCRGATRAAVRNLVLLVLVALISLLGGGKLAATNVFDTLTQFVPVEDCVNVRKSDDETTVQRRSATGDLCAFARERKSRVLVVQFVRGGEFGESAVRELFDSVTLPNVTASSITIEPYDARKHAEPDLVVEGPPKFSKLSSCALQGARIPWLQFSGEPGRYYEDDDWCLHDAPPIARLDTSFHHLCKVNQSSTVFVWVPYAAVAMRELLFDSKAQSSFDWKKWRERPNLLAWVASNCKVKRRQAAFRALHKHASRHGFGEVHALGACARNNVSDDVKPRSDGWSGVADVYRNYRFVLAMESQLEHGYITEKIVTAFSAGAVPVYYGDSDAAAFLFGKLNVPYIDVRYVWRRFAQHPVNYEYPKSADWFMIAQYMHDFEQTPRVYIEAQRANVARDKSQNGFEAYSLAETTSRCN